ncbi:hypothetical protein GCM10011390_02510 [Aureimonas endophytica]|uniref:Uncharacterized protein n=1 Tax=Aureimonas endophytica TaxID=2027858 RepID=A0A916ZD90_9HYPH|nr:hypothetical protein [Aureimonas endophytica]GGD87301.1 hypothetical protein GCM10011390_02510 [Aureimonas endophytica]
MIELEQKVVGRFRELGSKKMRGIDAWEQSQVRIGDAISYDRYGSEELRRMRPGRADEPSRHVFTLTVEGALRVQGVGFETFLGTVLVDAEEVANRKQDGAPIYLLRGVDLKPNTWQYWNSGLTKIAFRVSQVWYLVVRASDGMHLFSRAPGERRPDLPSFLKALRRKRRIYEEDFAGFRREAIVMPEAESWLADGRIGGSGHCIGSIYATDLSSREGLRLGPGPSFRPAMHLHWTTPLGWARSVEVIKATDGTLFAGMTVAEVIRQEREAEEAKAGPLTADDDPFAELLVI